MYFLGLLAVVVVGVVVVSMVEERLFVEIEENDGLEDYGF